MEEDLNQNINPSTEPVSATPVPPANQPPFGGWWKLAGLVLGAAILVIGIFYAGYQYSQKQPKPTTPLTTSPTPILDPTANWKTYQNTQAGISFKYPNGWIIEPYDVAGFSYFHGIVQLKIEGQQYGPEPATMSISYWDNPENLTLDKFEQKLNEGGGKYYSLDLPNAQKITIARISSYYWKSVASACEPVRCGRYMIPYKGRIFDIPLYFPTAEQQKETIDQILSTFRFD